MVFLRVPIEANTGCTLETRPRTSDRNCCCSNTGRDHQPMPRTRPVPPPRPATPACHWKQESCICRCGPPPPLLVTADTPRCSALDHIGPETATRASKSTRRSTMLPVSVDGAAKGKKAWARRGCNGGGLLILLAAVPPWMSPTALACPPNRWPSCLALCLNVCVCWWKLWDGVRHVASLQNSESIDQMCEPPLITWPISGCA